MSVSVLRQQRFDSAEHLRDKLNVTNTLHLHVHALRWKRPVLATVCMLYLVSIRERMPWNEVLRANGSTQIIPSDLRLHGGALGAKVVWIRIHHPHSNTSI